MQVPIFAGIGPVRLKLLAFASERMTYRIGQDLCRQGEPGDAAYVVLSGTADVIVGPLGDEIKVADVGENAIVGEIAVLCAVARTATVRATSPVQALRIRKDHFLELVHDFPQVAIEIMKQLANRLHHTTAELVVARTANLPSRPPQ